MTKIVLALSAVGLAATSLYPHPSTDSDRQGQLQHLSSDAMLVAIGNAASPNAACKKNIVSNCMLFSRRDWNLGELSRPIPAMNQGFDAPSPVSTKPPH
jgi:hypothetical protein